MDITTYQTLSGLTVSSANQTFVTAQIAKTRAILENLLGYTLLSANVDDNQYTELGKTALECPSTIDITALTAADAVTYAYRIFDYNHKDRYFHIDPASAIHKVKLINDTVTVKTLDLYDEYTVRHKHGFILYLETVESLLCGGCTYLDEIQLAVDATWLWPVFANMPDELRYLWTEMITWYSDKKKDLKSQTLGTHSYTKFDNTPPESMSVNIAIIQKYAGGNGSINKTLTV